jgi:hypothetical protein
VVLDVIAVVVGAVVVGPLQAVVGQAEVVFRTGGVDKYVLAPVAGLVERGGGKEGEAVVAQRQL